MQAIFTYLPLATMLAYLPLVLSTSGTYFHLLQAFLAILSLLMTAYMMRFIPSKEKNQRQAALSSSFGSPDIATLPEWFLPANSALCLFLSLVAWIGNSNYHSVFNLVPGRKWTLAPNSAFVFK